MNPLPVILLALLIIAIGSFWLGYDIAQSREREAARRNDRLIRSYNKAIADQHDKLKDFVQTNWPTEFEAYRQGTLQGYQQGLNNAALFEDDGEEHR